MNRRFYEAEAGTSDARRSAPAASRNVEPIGEVLAEWLPATGTLLEIASGTGEHAVAYAAQFPGILWQPSDCDDAPLASIAAWRSAADLPNLAPPLRIDVRESAWGIEHVDAIVAFNMVHISPWESSLGLLDGAAQLLTPGGLLILYGPWIQHDVETAPSNLMFDEDLKARDPQWGLRRVADFSREAEARGLFLEERRTMPANNIMLRFVRGEALGQGPPEQ